MMMAIKRWANNLTKLHRIPGRIFSLNWIFDLCYIRVLMVPLIQAVCNHTSTNALHHCSENRNLSSTDWIHCVDIGWHAYWLWDKNTSLYQRKMAVISSDAWWCSLFQSVVICYIIQTIVLNMLQCVYVTWVYSLNHTMNRTRHHLYKMMSDLIGKCHTKMIIL